MIRYALFFIIAFALGFAATFLPLRWANNHFTSGSLQGEAARLLAREALLIEHFCLNRYPPAPGRAAIPNEWEQALGSTIRLREGVGEVAGEAAELKERADAIRDLAAGQSVQITTRSEPRKHILVYRPRTTPSAYLVILKPNSAVRAVVGRELPVKPVIIALAISAALAAALTLAGAALSRRQT